MSEELSCLMCKSKVVASEEDVGGTVECGECRSVFLVSKRGGKLTLDYPDFSEGEGFSIRETPG